jgi:3-hydroxybutyryl-CoA dehydrogenase
MNPNSEISEQTIKSIGVVGSGAMGRGIAQLFAQSGYLIQLHDSQTVALIAAQESLGKTFEQLVSKGKVSAEQSSLILSRINYAHSLAQLSHCDVVIEAIVENLATKRTLFEQLEAICRPQTILVSNTSSLSITGIAAACKMPTRVAGLHFFNPVPLMKVVEIIAGVRTDPGVVSTLVKLVDSSKHTAVVCADFPGFIVNHAGRGYGTEALKIVSEGVADFATVDAVMREQVNLGGNGFKLGPFELMDLTGLDVSHPVMESIFRQFYDEPRFRPSVITALRNAGGLLGRKTGEGFYPYSDQAKAAAKAATDSLQSASSQSTHAALPVPPCWINPGPNGEALINLLKALDPSITIDTDVNPGPHSLIWLTPLGQDATTCAMQLGLNANDAQRVIAIDTLFSFGYKACKRRVIMGTPATQLQALEQAKQLLQTDGTPVSVIQDSAGFIAPRIIAMIVSIASEIAQQQIASAADIDRAVQLGLGYPQGPLTMGNTLGVSVVAQVLQQMYKVTRDPRYRIGLWLRRRAMLEMSLLDAPASVRN